MSRCFDGSQVAYKRGDGAEAKEQSNRGKEHQANMKRLNREASDWIYVSEYMLAFLFLSLSLD